MIEAAIGYYYPLPANNNWVLEFYGGYGHASGNEFSNYGSMDYKVYKLFVQPDFGYTFKLADIALSLRDTYCRYYNVNRSLDPNFDPSELYPLAVRPNHFMIEPAVTFRLGYKFIKFLGQPGYSSDLVDHYMPADNIIAAE